MAGTINGYEKTNFILQNGFVSDDDLIKDFLNDCDNDLGLTIIRDMNDEILFICKCGGEFMHKLTMGEIELNFKK